MENQIKIRYQALLLLDFQYDFLDENGRLQIASDQVKELVSSTIVAIRHAKEKNDLIIMIGNEFRKSQFISNIFRKNSALQRSLGASWDKQVFIPEGIYLSKSKKDAFSNRNLSMLLQQHNIIKVVLTGVFAKDCINTTARAAIKKGFSVEVLTPAVGCKSNTSKEDALSRLSKIGVTLINEYI